MTLEFDARDRDSVLRDLDDGDAEVRRLAVERVGALPPEDAVSRLVECLGDSSWRVRKAAVERLVATAELAPKLQALIRALGDGENPGRRNAAVEALVACGETAVPMLMDACASPDCDVRKLVVDALAGIGDPRSLEPLIANLKDLDPNVRAAAADAIGAIGGERAEVALLAVATRPNEEKLVRFSAVHALAALEAPVRLVDLGEILDDPVLCPAALAMLGRHDDPDAPPVLLKALTDPSRATREAAMRALLRVLARLDGAEEAELTLRIRETVSAVGGVVDSATERLGEADLPTRLALVQFLGLVQAPDAIVPVLLAGQDEALGEVVLATLETLGPASENAIDAEWGQLSEGARRDACVLFGRTGGAMGVSRLLAALEDFSAEVRSAAARSIGERRVEAGLPLLVRRLAATASDDDFESEEELATVIDALIALASPSNGASAELTERAISLLAATLEGADENMRLAVAQVLGHVGRPQDTEIVTFLLKDPSARVRRAAVDALAHLDPGTAAEPLRLALADESSSVRIAAAGALGASQSDSVIEDLRRLADDEDARVRGAAAASVVRRFSEVANSTHREAVIAVLDVALNDEAPVALAAVGALRAVGGSYAARAASVLGRPDPDLVREAIGCLAAHGDASQVESLFPLVEHPDWSVRAEAIQALADRRVTRAVPHVLRRLETEQDDFVRDVILRALEKLES